MNTSCFQGERNPEAHCTGMRRCHCVALSVFGSRELFVQLSLKQTKGSNLPVKFSTVSCSSGPVCTMR